MAGRREEERTCLMSKEAHLVNAVNSFSLDAHHHSPHLYQQLLIP